MMFRCIGCFFNRGLFIALAAILGMTLAVSASAQRISLNDLLLQIQQLESMMCGDVDIETCAERIAPSALERIEALEFEVEETLVQLCDLASQTGSVLAACGPLDGDLRIVDGANADEGRLELFWQDQWGTVCDDRWDINDATVACRQMGYSGADAALFTFNVVDGSGPILLDDVQCTGTENLLLDCVHREPVGSHNCSHFEDAGVRCTTTP
jgi:hypothetical protein